MPSSHANRVQMTVSSVASAGLGTITLGSASSGYRSFATAYGADATVDVLITEGTSWEVARGCAYTNSGTTLGRGTLESSSTGSAVAFTSAATVSVIATADFGNRLERAMQSVIPGGRLTLTSATPVTTSDVTAASTLYYTPHVHDTVPLWDGARWVPTTFTETSLALSGLTSGKPYDVFGYLSSGSLALELLVWTNDTTRATAVTLQDGRLCKSGDKTRLWIGSIYTTGTTTTEDSDTKRYVFNAYNRAFRRLYKTDATSHSYNGGYRQWNNTAGNKVEFLVGDPSGGIVSMGSAGEGASSGTVFCINAQALDSTTTFNFLPAYAAGISNGFGAAAVGEHRPSTGYHYIAATQSTASTGSATFSSFCLIGGLQA